MAGGCCRSLREALSNTLPQNYALFEALTRREAREALRLIDAYASVKSAATEEGSQQLKAHLRELGQAAGYGAAEQASDDPAGYTPIEDLLAAGAA